MKRVIEGMANRKHVLKIENRLEKVATTQFDGKLKAV